MARYKPCTFDQMKLIPVSYSRQILPGTFEHTLCEVIDTLDVSAFEGRYRNDATGAPAYDPRILLKVILYAYSRGIIFFYRDRFRSATGTWVRTERESLFGKGGATR